MRLLITLLLFITALFSFEVQKSKVNVEFNPGGRLCDNQRVNPPKVGVGYFL